MRFWPFKKDRVADDGRIALGNFSLNAQLAGASGRTIQVAGYIYSDDNEGALNERLDLYQRVIERQRLRCEIPELEAKKEQMLKHLEQARAVMADLEEKQKGVGLSSQERLNLKNMSVSIGKVNEEIEKGEQAIREARLKAGVG